MKIKIQNTIGWIILILIFIAIIIATAFSIGIEGAIIVWGFSILLTAIVTLAAYLISK
jgi:hypothetical protein